MFGGAVSKVSIAAVALIIFAQPTALCASPPARISPEAKAYLDRALALFREQHINAGNVDWPTLSQKAYDAVTGAKTTADTYPAIRLIITALGEKHTSFVTPDYARAMATGKPSGNALPPPLMLPEGMRLANGIGVIRLYGFSGSAEEATRYADAAQAKISEMKSAGVCRFVLDLREDSGGNMYPMLNAVRDLLEPGMLGAFQTPQGKYVPWALRDGDVKTAPPQDMLPAKEQDRNALPVAILIGPQTASAGEFTAISFAGRSNSRFFGAPSAGFVTANSPMPLSDGAVLVMTNSWGVDRTGKKYADRLEPDENTGAGGAALDAAVAWLLQRPCKESGIRIGAATDR